MVGFGNSNKGAPQRPPEAQRPEGDTWVQRVRSAVGPGGLRDHVAFGYRHRDGVVLLFPHGTDAVSARLGVHGAPFNDGTETGGHYAAEVRVAAPPGGHEVSVEALTASGFPSAAVPDDFDRGREHLLTDAAVEAVEAWQHDPRYQQFAEHKLAGTAERAFSRARESLDRFASASGPKGHRLESLLDDVASELARLSPRHGFGETEALRAHEEITVL